jgi:hypothetical protein
MFATVRRYEGIDTSHKHELTKNVGESLAPRLSKLPGFSGYFLIDTGEGVMSSIGLVSHPSGCATRSSRGSSRVRPRSRTARSSSRRPTEPFGRKPRLDAGRGPHPQALSRPREPSCTRKAHP